MINERAIRFEVLNARTGQAVRSFEDAAPALHYAARMEFQNGGRFNMRPVFA